MNQICPQTSSQQQQGSMINREKGSFSSHSGQVQPSFKSQTGNAIPNDSSINMQKQQTLQNSQINEGQNRQPGLNQTQKFEQKQVFQTINGSKVLNQPQQNQKGSTDLNVLSGNKKIEIDQLQKETPIKHNAESYNQGGNNAAKFPINSQTYNNSKLDLKSINIEQQQSKGNAQPTQQFVQKNQMEIEIGGQQQNNKNYEGHMEQLNLQKTTSNQQGYIESKQQEEDFKIEEIKNTLTSADDKQEIQKNNIQIKPLLLNQNEIILKLLEICRKNNITDPELENLEECVKRQFNCCNNQEQKIFSCSKNKCTFHLNCLRNRLDNFDTQEEYKCQCGDVLPTRILQEVDAICTRYWLEKRLEQESQNLKKKLYRPILKCQAPFCTYWCYQSETYQPNFNYYCISCQVSTNLERELVIQQYR